MKVCVNLIICTKISISKFNEIGHLKDDKIGVKW